MSTVTRSAVVTSEDVHRWLDAWNSHDLDRIKALFADDVIMHQPQNPEPLTKDSMIAFFSGLFATFPDLHFDTDGMTIEGLEVASWEIASGTMKGPFKSPTTGQDIPPTGRSFSIPAAIRLKYTEEHLIREVTIYWDRVLLMQQAGLSS